MGSIAVNQIDWAIVNDNPFFCPDPNCIAPMEALIDELRRAGDSVGARINVIAEGVMPGLGEPVFDRLDAELAKAMMSINAVKGVEVGDGFSVVEQRGSEHRDEIRPEGFLSNHSGGVLGGRACRRRHHRAARPLRWRTGNANRRGDDGAGPDGSPYPLQRTGQRTGSKRVKKGAFQGGGSSQLVGINGPRHHKTIRSALANRG